jgi:SAM-dependent methyltransferase
MLVKEAEQTIGVATSSLARGQGEGFADSRAAHLYLESLGLSESEKQGIVELAQSGKTRIDPVVAFLVGATSGDTYKHLIGSLDEYPIPELRLPDSNGASFLDLGCNWGRWCIAATRKGYAVTGVDPSLGAVMAARRVARQLDLPNRYLVADARYLPFRGEHFSTVFSYSVLQHLSKSNVRMVLSEVKRVLRAGGQSLIQMPNWLGVRSLYHQGRRRFREGRDFDVRYWGISELERTFESTVGPSSTSVDCYFGLGLQKSDMHLMTGGLKLAVRLSERLRSVSKHVGALKYLADSVYVQSTKNGSRR